MISYKALTYSDAVNIVDRFGLAGINWGSGSTQGFIDRLHRAGIAEVNIIELGERLEEYLDEVNEHPGEGHLLDARMAADRAELIESLAGAAESRQELIKLIQDVKYGPCGSLTWPAVAQLACTAREHRLEALVMEPPVAQEVATFLRDLEALQLGFDSSLLLDYYPGVSEVQDHLVRMAIEQFDVTLAAAPPWAGTEEHWFYEMCALLGLVKDTAFREWLDGQGFSDEELLRMHRAEVSPA